MEKENPVLQKVILFIENFNPVFKEFSINEDTTIEEDLKITGDDVADLFMEYKSLFNVDISNFKLYNYFQEESYIYNGAKLIRNQNKGSLQPFTIGDLVKGIKSGKLDENVLSNP